MLDEFLFNENEIGFDTPPAVLTQDNIVFNGYSLQSANFITSEIDYDDQKNIELNTFKFPQIDGGGVNSRYYRGRKISMKGVIKAPGSATDFNNLIDEVKKSLSGIEGNLDIRVNDEVRRIKATVTNLQINRKHYNITFADIQVEFTTAEAFFHAVTDQSYTFEAMTGTFVGDMDHNGSAKTSPDVYFVFGAGTTATALSITDAAGRVITVTTALTNGDVIFIDGEEKTVSKNGTQIDFSGSFPIFSPGGNNFTVGFTGTVLSDVSFIVKKNYL